VKQLVAILRPGKLTQTKEALSKIGCVAMTSVRVYGRGRQKGLRGSVLTNDSRTPQVVVMKYLPKKMIYLMVRDRELHPVVQTLIRVNQTGEHGDGKIFVLDLKSAQRIRTNEKGEAAIR
jgi:nitrogen regulatory protein PII 2